MLILQTIYFFIAWGVTAIIVAAVILILLRSLFNYMDVNPFSRSAITIKRVTDPVILPVRRALVAFRVDPRAAPLVAMLIIILVGWFTVQLASGLLNTIAGVLHALTSGSASAPAAIIGYLLYGLLGFYTMLIFIRIIFSWFAVSYGNRLMRFLILTTEPLLAPLRRTIPPVRMFDISAIVAFVIVWLLQAAVVGTLLRDWQVRFF
jgi:YggT family protein